MGRFIPPGRRAHSDDGAGVGILLAEDGGEPVGVSGDSVDALAHRRRVVAPVLPGEVLVPPRRRLPPRQRRRRVPEQVPLRRRRRRLRAVRRPVTVLALTTSRAAAVVFARLLLLLLFRRWRFGAKPDAAGLLLFLASFRAFRRLRLGRWWRVLRLLGWLVLGLGLGWVGMMIRLVLGWCLWVLGMVLWRWRALLLLRRWRRHRFGRYHVDGIGAGEGHRARHWAHVVGLHGRARRIGHGVVQPLFPPSLAPVAFSERFGHELAQGRIATHVSPSLPRRVVVPLARVCPCAIHASRQ
uniref:Uncharacterized protein n=1 Tax=Arundo donax TaxID=35708 RepID=A0A0A9DSE5_ARUDO